MPYVGKFKTGGRALALKNGQNLHTYTKKTVSHQTSRSKIASPMMVLYIEPERTLWERNGLIETPTMRGIFCEVIARLGMKILATF